MGKKVKKVKKVKKIRKEASTQRRLDEAFDYYHDLTKRYEGHSIEKIIEVENPTLKELAYFMLGFRLSEGGKEKK